MPDTRATGDFWSFAESAWSDPGLRDRLMSWQDHHGADVIRVLFAAWHPGALTTDDLDRLHARARDWSTRATLRIRALRRRLHTPERHALYRALLELELRAEHLGALHLLQECPPPAADAAPHRRPRADTIGERLARLEPGLPPDERSAGAAELASSSVPGLP
ncbi:DUF2390 domain-containing protein [Thioalkalivibrio sp. ALgr3]|uniref:DUF2390 domain-containing protein n=1 Tax=Thioalkalivibrio sp. ALgr3 TaxID=1239292 RepID=UPI00037BE39A|nr:DUF2390 domain-containing protein [Thioalkalivibrio sp. ALgr3]